jgi:hypothetical protein
LIDKGISAQGMVAIVEFRGGPILVRIKRMGHRLTTALIFLNAMGLFACLILIAANSNQTPDVAIHFTRAIQFSIRMFVVGIGLPLAAWEIAAAEFDRSNNKVRLLESWTTYLLLIVSWILFFIAAWRLPTLIINGLRA